MNKYAAVIYDHHNIVTRVEERPTEDRANRDGQFWTRMTGWYKVVEGEEEIEMYKGLINA